MFNFIRKENCFSKNKNYIFLVVGIIAMVIFGTFIFYKVTMAAVLNSPYPQRYGEYILQHIDYNSDYNGDAGDSDGDGNARGDYDDLLMGDGPNVFNSGAELKELYLISGDGKRKTLFRWNVRIDPNAPTPTVCDTANGLGVSCLGNVEILRLQGFDWGIDHDVLFIDDTQNDGVIDTWVIDKDLDPNYVPNPLSTTLGYTIAGSNNTNYWLPMFPESMNISNFKIFLYPNKNFNLSWKSNLIDEISSPYLKISFYINPSWSEKKKSKLINKQLKFSTTINLADIFSN